MTHSAGYAHSMRQKLREEEKIDGKTDAIQHHVSVIWLLLLAEGLKPLYCGKKGTSCSPLNAYSSFKKDTELQKERKRKRKKSVP